MHSDPILPDTALQETSTNRPSAGPGLRWLVWLSLGVAVLFAGRALALVDATSLWGDELSTARKSFQPSLAYLFTYLTTDTHPPLYYGLLWLWGQLVPDTAVFLRLFSWGSYLLGGGVIVAQVAQMARPLAPPRRHLAVALAVILAFCSPFPIRFSIEAKGYALLVLWIALALLCRRRWYQGGKPADGIGYGLALAAASLTHYYGLFYGVALAITDLTVPWRPLRLRLESAAVCLVAALPSLAWIWHSRRYLLEGSEAGEWIGRPDGGMAEEVLARALGPWPLPKLALLLAMGALYLVLCSRRVTAEAGLGVGIQRPWLAWLDGSGLLSGGLLVLLVVGVSFVKPIAYPRYFVVLLPAAVPVVALAFASLPAPASSLLRLLPLALATALVLTFWVDSFRPLQQGGVFQGSREMNDFRLLVLVSQDTPVRISPRAHHFRTAERLLRQAGTMNPAPVSPGPVPPRPAPTGLDSWGDLRDLRRLLRRQQPPDRLVMAETGGPDSVQRRIDPALARVEELGYACRRDLPSRPHLRLYRCHWPAAAQRLEG
ncbi:hypothetical protein H8F24_04730 [Synechococcus sp. CBW1002]|uniref:glycosyltransferase family 39 protein n=1 Tax=Synechococcus sp. CBW1002 TaxID=1353134 RepID=UPI0018CE864B|nr:glycosyltransferase family 39 protein [Synechococcus sp. CBW1002]QPN60704.1 hypothetical protein H8F24_04730 [Synechococcus sp. CBW1002]